MTSQNNRLAMSVPSTPEAVAEIRNAVCQFAQSGGFDDETVEAIKLAVSEAVTNAVLQRTTRSSQPPAGSCRSPTPTIAVESSPACTAAGRFTPLLLALLAIGTSDLLFAFDSIPAVFGVTDHAYILLAANAFALLGLRALYFLLSGLLDRLVYLSTGLAAIVAFIGAKLILEFAHQQHHSIPEIPTGPSLALIAAVLAATTVASLIKARRDPSAHAHAGALRQHHHDASPTTRLPDQDRAPRHPSEGLAAGSSDERPISDKRRRGTLNRLVGRPRPESVRQGWGCTIDTKLEQSFDKDGSARYTRTKFVKVR